MHIIKGSELKVNLATQIWEYVYERAKAHGDKIAQVDAETKQSLTFHQILSRSQQVCQCLQNLGLRKDDVVAICSENNLEYCWILLGALKAGAACALINPHYTPRELDHAFAISKPKIVLCSALVAKTKSTEVFAENKNVNTVLVWGSKSETLPPTFKRLEDMLDNKCTHTAIHNLEQRDDIFTSSYSKDKNIALILSSSGSTGLPKGVMLLHRNIVGALSSSAIYASENAIALGILPFFHAYGLILMLMCLCEGSKVIVMTKFRVDSFILNIQSYNINCLYLVPSLLVLLTKKKVISSLGFRSIRHVWTGAAPVSPKVQQLISEQLCSFGSLHHSYGLTETTFVMFTAPYKLSKAGSVGCLTPGMECKVIDLDTGNTLGPNEKGELCFKGPLIMEGYKGNEDATQDTIDKDGWLHTGDLGYYDSDHYFFIVDRLKELIKYQGYQVSPSELESILLTHNAIQDAAVLGIPDEVFGELPLALVIKQSGACTTENEIKEFIASRVAPYKRLHGGVKFVNVIPKTVSGKIKRKELKESL